MISPDTPLPQLTMMAQELGDKYVKNLVRLSQRGAWLELRDRTERPGIAYRMSKAGHAGMGFSFRLRRYQRKKGNLADYRFTGAFDASILGRAPKTKVNGSEIATKFSIFGGALNGLANRKGYINEGLNTANIQRSAYTRRGRNGQPVSVRAYFQLGPEPQVRASRTYADEWAYRPEEIAWVQMRTDEIGAALFRETAFNAKGELRTNPRVTKANLKEIIGA